MPMLKMTAALLSPATAASLKWAYTMHMDTRLKKKSPQSRSESCAAGWGSVWKGRVGLMVGPEQATEVDHIVPNMKARSNWVACRVGGGRLGGGGYDP